MRLGVPQQTMALGGALEGETAQGISEEEGEIIRGAL